MYRCFYIYFNFNFEYKINIYDSLKPFKLILYLYIYTFIKKFL